MNAIPLDQQRFARYDASTATFVLAIVTDEDQAAQVELDDGQIAWQSTVRYDRLYRQEAPDTGQVSYDVEQIPPEEGGLNRLISLVAEGGRGAECSELALFGERLLAFDDRTGMACEIREGHQLIPRQILMTGSGDERFKGVKGEWATPGGDKVIPGRPRECVGLQSVEIGDETETYPFCFHVDGNVLQRDTFLGAYKCEGVEIP